MHSMKRGRSIALVLGVADITSLLAVFNLVANLRGIATWEHPVIVPLILPCLFLIIAIHLIDGYNARTSLLSLDYTSLHTIAICGVTLATLLATFVFFPAGYSLQQSRGVIALSYLLLIPVTLIQRRALYLRSASHQRQRTIVFAGDVPSCLEFAKECITMKLAQPVVLSVANPTGELPAQLIPFRNALHQIEEHKLDPEALVLRESNWSVAPDMSEELVKLYFRGVPTYTLELFYEIYWRKVPLYRLNQVWLFQEGFEIAREPVFERIKRLSDILLAGVALLIFAPLLLVCGLFIWLEDRGSIFFLQTRIGRNRVPFRIVKLRSMRAQPAGNVYTQKDDDRITRVGRFLRATRLDEFPQLWNVLRGEMSMIGPRAEWDILVKSYEEKIPCYHFRHLVKPGITGWAQVNYPYGANLDDTLRKLEYDLYYIRHFSFLLDASIVLKTIQIILFGKGR